jgi:hypothetical protein
MKLWKIVLFAYMLYISYHSSNPVKSVRQKYENNDVAYEEYRQKKQ